MLKRICTLLLLVPSMVKAVPLPSLLDDIMAQQAPDQPGLSVLVRHHDKVIYQRSEGLANRHTGQAITADTGFRLGSISKPFTAVAIMRLAEQGRLSLGHQVSRYIPTLPTVWQSITLEDLLAHRVFLSQDFFADDNLSLADGADNATLVTFLSSDELIVRPLEGGRGIYCNSCYVLLAEVVSQVSKIPFADFLQREVFEPAQMVHSHIVASGKALAASDALNYAQTRTFLGIRQYTTGAMAQVSSVSDLNRFIRALKAGRIVRSDTLTQMTRIHGDLGEDGVYGLGWFIGPGKQPFFAHGGSQDGYQTELFIDPQHDLEVVILSNGGETTYALQVQIMRTVLQSIRGE